MEINELTYGTNGQVIRESIVGITLLLFYYFCSSLRKSTLLSGGKPF